MNKKTILISIVLIGLAFILYKLLFGLVIPIALFVSLGYILKLLLKDSETAPVKDVSQIFNNSETPISIDNILEIKPVEENKS